MSFSSEQRRQWEALADQRAAELSSRDGKPYASALNWNDEGEEHHIILSDGASVREAIRLIDNGMFTAAPLEAVTQSNQLRAKLRRYFHWKQSRRRVSFQQQSLTMKGVTPHRRMMAMAAFVLLSLIMEVISLFAKRHQKVLLEEGCLCVQRRVLLSFMTGAALFLLAFRGAGERDIRRCLLVFDGYSVR